MTTEHCVSHSIVKHCCVSPRYWENTLHRICSSTSHPRLSHDGCILISRNQQDLYHPPATPPSLSPSCSWLSEHPYPKLGGGGVKYCGRRDHQLPRLCELSVWFRIFPLHGSTNKRLCFVNFVWSVIYFDTLDQVCWKYVSLISKFF